MEVAPSSKLFILLLLPPPLTLSKLLKQLRSKKAFMPTMKWKYDYNTLWPPESHLYQLKTFLDKIEKINEVKWSKHIHSGNKVKPHPKTSIWDKHISLNLASIEKVKLFFLYMIPVWPIFPANWSITNQLPIYQFSSEKHCPATCCCHCTQFYNKRSYDCPLKNI